MDELLTVRELAARLRLHPKTLYAFVARGSIPHIRIGRRVLFSAEQVQIWLRAREGGM
jgi:excisionase family DNA binding protein